ERVTVGDHDAAPAFEDSASEHVALEEGPCATHADVENAPRRRAVAAIELRVAADLLENLVQVRARLMPERAAQAHRPAIRRHDDLFVHEHVAEPAAAPIEQADEPVAAEAGPPNVLAEKQVVPLDLVRDGRIVELEVLELRQQGLAEVLVGVDRQHPVAASQAHHMVLGLAIPEEVAGLDSDVGEAATALDGRVRRAVVVDDDFRKPGQRFERALDRRGSIASDQHWIDIARAHGPYPILRRRCRAATRTAPSICATYARA